MMRLTDYFYIFLFTILLVSCKKTVTESEEYTLIGKWSFSSATFEHVLTTSSPQIAKIPYSGEGHLVASGLRNVVLNKIALYSYDPLVFLIWNVENDIYRVEYLLIDEDTQNSTFYSPLTEQTYAGTITYTFDGVTLNISESTLINQNDSSDTISVSGEISFETENIPVNTKTYIELPPVISTYPKGFMQYEFREDGTFFQTINYNDGSVTSFGTWESDGNTITTTIAQEDYTEVHTIEYSIENNILSGSDEYGLCQSNQDNSECFGSFEKYYQIEEGSLIQILMNSTIYLRAVNEIN